jgi:hypothetical protein
MNEGTTPPGAQTEEQAARWVRRMFDGVAPRYDLLNHLLSLNADKYWRWKTVRELQPFLAKPGARIVDLFDGAVAVGGVAGEDELVGVAFGGEDLGHAVRWRGPSRACCRA